MFRPVRSLIRLAIFGGLLFLLFQSNPAPERHQAAIATRVRRLAENDPMLKVAGLLHTVAEQAGAYPYTYRDHRLYSMMKDGDETVTLGIAGRVFIMKQDFKTTQ